MSETRGARKAIDQMTKRLIESGVKPRDARKAGREAAIRRDRKDKR